MIHLLMQHAKQRRIEQATLVALACWKPEALKKISDDEPPADPDRALYERLKAIAKPAET